MNRTNHLEVKPHKNQSPSLELNDTLVNKFLKLCSKESLLQFLYEKSSYTRRFEKDSVVERRKRLKYKRNAQKAGQENMKDALEPKNKTHKLHQK